MIPFDQRLLEMLKQKPGNLTFLSDQVRRGTHCWWLNMLSSLASGTLLWR